MTTQEIAKFFGVSEERIKQQYATNAKGLAKMRDKALAKGKKVNGYTAAELTQMTAEYQLKSK